MEGYIAEIRLFAGNFAPRFWSLCNGSLLGISSNTALFSLLGTTYGGNGVQTFALPDLRSRVAVGTGQGSGLPYITLGEVGGAESVSLLSSQIPSHTHGAAANVAPGAFNGAGGDSSPTGGYPAEGATDSYGSGKDNPLAQIHPTVNVYVAGSSMAHENMQPSLCAEYIICMYGIYPSRS